MIALNAVRQRDVIEGHLAALEALSGMVLIFAESSFAEDEAVRRASYFIAEQIEAQTDGLRASLGFTSGVSVAAC